MTAYRVTQALAALLLVPAATSAEDFRVETDVFVGEARQPVAETLTLFSGAVVYDFVLTDPKEMTVLDFQLGRIFLLNPESKIKSSVSTEELLSFTAAIRARAQNDKKKQLFGTEFTGDLNKESGEVLLEGENLSYRASGKLPKFSVATKKYRDFADWYARLNAARPGNPPPFGRIELNRRLFDGGLVPVEIVRSLRLLGERRVVKSRHVFTWLLSSTDVKRIDVAGQAMETYEDVSLPKYWGLDSAPDPRNGDR
jgi:hypothetical protein